MTERPILFSAPMVRALLAGTKTQTRRVVKSQGAILTDRMARSLGVQPPPEENCAVIPCPYGVPGDILRVRETAWERPERTQRMMRDGADTWPPYIYDADYWPNGIPDEEAAIMKRQGWKRRPSIHLPRLGCRIKLEIADVRVERLNDISEEDARAEGVEWKSVDTPDGIKNLCFGNPYIGDTNAKSAFASLWDMINNPKGYCAEDEPMGWAANPWVWCVEFRRMKP
jgi:hypothetical protein